MRRFEDIFSNRHYRGTGEVISSPASITAIILTVVSAIAAIFVIANYDEITARIAIWIVGFLTSAVPVVILILLILYFLARLKWRLFGRW